MQYGKYDVHGSEGTTGRNPDHRCLRSSREHSRGIAAALKLDLGCCFVIEQPSSMVEKPATFFVDGNRQDFVFVFVNCFADIPGGDQRNLVLCRLAAEQDR